MDHRIRTKVIVLAASLFLMFGWQTAEAAYPRLLMVYGKLPKPLVVRDAYEIADILEASSDGVDRDRLQVRPYFELALFWGNDWNRYMDEGKPVDRLKPEDVTPFSNIPIHGKFYPACTGAAAQITLTAVGAASVYSIWRVSEKGLKALERLGVPTRPECK